MPRPCCARTNASTTSTARTAPSTRPLPYDHSPTAQPPKSGMSDESTGSVGCYASISTSREVCRASGTHRRGRSASAGTSCSTALYALPSVRPIRIVHTDSLAGAAAQHRPPVVAQRYTKTSIVLTTTAASGPGARIGLPRPPRSRSQPGHHRQAVVHGGPQMGLRASPGSLDSQVLSERDVRCLAPAASVSM